MIQSSLLTAVPNSRAQWQTRATQALVEEEEEIKHDCELRRESLSEKYGTNSGLPIREFQNTRDVFLNTLF
jgi:hypothetical protein